jgi:AcrR family transcriptional regulator
VRNSRSAKHVPYHHGDLRRALIDAALALVTEEQDWTFSLREVARRAGVSHNAPYNHFPEKRNLLGAIAATGFKRLRDGLLSAIAGIEDAEEALIRSGLAYVRLGVENPALYRLMFGSALADQRSGDHATEALTAGNEAKAVLQAIVQRGARSGAFAVAANNEQDVALATFALWSNVHGLTLMIIDGLTVANLPTQNVIEGAIRLQVRALRPGLVGRAVQPTPIKAGPQRGRARVPSGA